MIRKLSVAALAALLGLTTVAPVLNGEAPNIFRAASAAPISPTDGSKIPHYFGPYPNWANSPQTLADAIVNISLGTPTPVSFGNALTSRAYATDYATAPGTLGPVFVVLPGAVLPNGSLQSFQTWNQLEPAGSPTASAGNLFHAYVLRPTGTANQFTVVYDSGVLTVPVVAASAVATFTPSAPVAVQAGDVLGFYGEGIPVATGVTLNPDLFSTPATADPTLATNIAPIAGSTLTLGVDPGFPIYATQDRTYSFAASVIPTVTDPGTGAQATATVDPKTGAVSAITVTSPGAGYVLPPTVSITSPGVTPTALASASAVIATGVVTGIAVNESGFGFTTPSVAISGGGPTTPATAQASGGVDNITLNNGGSGYTIQPIVKFSLPDLATGTVATATATMTGGIVDGITMVNPGSGYTSAPTLTILDGAAVNPTSAIASATIGISQIDVTSGGQGYTSVPAITITDTGSVDRGASATATIAAKGAVTAINVTAPGAGYLTPGLKKFVDTLPGLGAGGANNYGQYIPVAVADTTTYPGADYYEIAVVQYRQQFSSQLPATLLRGYVQLSTTAVPGDHIALTNATLDPLVSTPVLLPDGTQAYGVDNPHYLGPTIVATKDKPVRVLFRNLLPTGVAGDLFLPVDTSLMGSGMGPNAITLDANGVPKDMAINNGTVTDGVRNPVCGETPKPTNCYSENRATLHLHGGITPWISDGTPHQWTTPAGEVTDYPKGVSVSNVPDMPDPGPGAETFFYTNQQSARLMFYHDHAWGITRLNVYAGEAAGYLLTDAIEQNLIAPGGALDGLGVGTPLIIQDKTFVPSSILKTDPTWNSAKWGSAGSLWTPHVYMPAQNPSDPTGLSAFGRWMYGPWFWPPAKDVTYPPIANPYYDPACDPNVQPFCEPQLIPSTPNVSVGMEAFNDTPIVNGTAYPTTTVDPKAYRYRILNAANDRFWNLQWYVADPTTGTLSEVALKPTELAAAQTDPNVVPTPDTSPGKSPVGPSWIQIGTEGGFLPTPAVIPNQPITWITDPTRFDFGNVDQHSLLLAPAERADVIVDFSAYRGKTLILYNDAPAAFPARVASYDYYTGNPDLTPVGAPSTLPGYGPNTRTIMQVKVSNAAPAVAFDRPNTTSDRMGALMAAFAHHADGSGVFEKGSDPIIVGQAAYNATYGTSFVAAGNCSSPTNPTAKCDGFARIQQGSQPTDLFKFDTLSGTQLKIPFQPKGMHDEMNSASFDDWGRMTANLGLEAPGATPLTQNIILYPYVNPATEILDATGLPSSLNVTPISSAADGTQIWKITHNGVDTHPIHFHLYDVQVINRVTWDGIIMPPDANELGWKDTVRVSPLEDTIVAVRPIVPTLPFGVPDSYRPLNPMMPIGARGDVNGILGTEAGFNNTDTNGNPIAPIVNTVVDFGWEYVFHCHILSHEEMDMMRPVTVHVARALPAAPVLSFTRGSVILHWTDGTPANYSDLTTWGNAANEVGFRIERAPVLNGVVGAYVLVTNSPANTTTYTDVPDPTVTYNYMVTAWNAAGDAPSNVITVEGLPKAPTALNATVQAAPSLTAGAQVALDWTNNATNATNVVVERAVGAGSFSVLATLASSATTYVDTSVLPGPYSYRVNAVNAVGPSAYSNIATVTVAQPGSTTVVLNAPNPSYVGQSVTFTATVSPVSATGIPSGTVTFTANGVATPVAVDGSGVAVFSTSTLPAGANTVTAAYGGDAIFLPSSASVTQTVNKTDTTTGLVSNLNPSTAGDSVTFTATVSPTLAIGTPTGTVDFFDGLTSVGTSTLTGGAASLSISTLTVGSHSITAVYGGDAVFNGSTSGPLTQVVNRGATATVVTSNLNPSYFGQSVTFNATVSPVVATGTPSGTVDFFDGLAPVGTSTLTGGAASLSISTLTVGSHSITAVYGGDARFSGSVSAANTQVVNQGTSATAVTSNLNPSSFGQSVTFNATVSVVNGIGTPTGSVEFFDGTTSLGTSPVTGGAASLPISSLAVATHSITAVYGGDTNFAGSTSAVIFQVVNKGTTAIAVTSNLNPSTDLTSVTFTGTVSVLVGTGSPSGSVQFFDGGTSLGTSPLGPTGTASITTAPFATGNHLITAVYSGDGNFTGSTSPVITQVVLRATTTVVTSNRAPWATFGQNTTFTATVGPVLGTGIPTGTVQFNVDGVNVGAPVALNALGRATYSTATLAAGNHNVIATYGGTAVFASSASATFTQLVNKATSAVVLTSNRNPSVYGASVTFTARVTPLAAIGTVNFYIDGVDSGPVALDATGRARLTISSLAVGLHTISAAYNGSTNYLPSLSANLAETVNRAASRTVVTTSGTPAAVGSTVTFTATVTAVAPGTGIPTGMVQFRLDGLPMGGLVALNPSGQATFSTSTIPIGRHTVSAVYSSDTNFNASTSGNITQRIR